MPFRLVFLALACIAAVMAFGIGRESYAAKYRDTKLSGWCLAATMALVSVICFYVAFGAPC